MVAKTNRKMDEYYRKKPVQSDVAMSTHYVKVEQQQTGNLPEEEKKEVSRPHEETK